VISIDPLYFIGKSEVNRPFGAPRHRWENNSTLDRKRIVCEIVEWIPVVEGSCRQ
jgi:hypothetical protein